MGGGYNEKQVLLPQQDAIKSNRGRGGSRSNGFTPRKGPIGPHFAIVIVKGKVGGAFGGKAGEKIMVHYFLSGRFHGVGV